MINWTAYKQLNLLLAWLAGFMNMTFTSSTHDAYFLLRTIRISHKYQTCFFRMWQCDTCVVHMRRLQMYIKYSVNFLQNTSNFLQNTSHFLKNTTHIFYNYTYINYKIRRIFYTKYIAYFIQNTTQIFYNYTNVTYNYESHCLQITLELVTNTTHITLQN